MPVLAPPPLTQAMLDRNGNAVQVWKDWFLRSQTSLVTGTAPDTGFYLVTQSNVDLHNAIDLGAMAPGYLHIRTATPGTVTVLSGFAVTAQASPSDPTGSASLVGLMMGLAVPLTPLVTGRLQVIVTGTIANATAIADGANVQLRYGTGTAPVNGAALVGTPVGGLVKYIAATVLQKAPFTVSAIISGLTLNTAIWLDLGLAAVTGGTATVKDLSVSAVEL